MQPLLPSLAPLDDAGLRAELPRVVQSERSSTVVVVARLAEFDQRRLYLGLGFSSLFAYCTEELKLSEHAAYERIEAARAVRRCPELLHRLASGSLTLTTLCLVAPRVSTGDTQILEAAAGKTKREVKEILVAQLPEQPVVSSVRKLPAASVSQPPSRRPVVDPVSADQYRIVMTASRAMKDRLGRMQDRMRHKFPHGDPAAIYDWALAIVEQQMDRKLLGGGVRKRKARPTRPGSRHVPAEVQRAVWKRDAGRCAFVAKDGRRCAATGGLEFHHMDPYALGGEATLRNISLRCRPHNAYEAEAWFGSWELGPNSVWTEFRPGAIREAGA